jgi:hypothetical protein
MAAAFPFKVVQSKGRLHVAAAFPFIKVQSRGRLRVAAFSKVYISGKGQVRVAAIKAKA